MQENNCSFCSVLMKLSNIWNGFVPVLKRSSCHLGNLTDTLFSLSKYAELPRMNNTPYYLSLWGWIAWDHHDCVRGSLQELENRILNFSMVDFDRALWKELKKRSEDSGSVAEGGVISFCSLVHPYASWCSRWSIVQSRTAGYTWGRICLELFWETSRLYDILECFPDLLKRLFPIEGRLSLQLFQKV